MLRKSTICSVEGTNIIRRSRISDHLVFFGGVTGLFLKFKVCSKREITIKSHIYTKVMSLKLNGGYFFIFN